MKRIIFLLLIPFLFLSISANGQDGNSQVTYSNLALQFSTMNFNGDAGTGYFPSVATTNGYGSYIDNPASVALIKDSYFNFGMVNNQVDYESSYLENTIVNEDNTTNLGNIGFVYKIPTEQGSFVLGGGYNRLKSDKSIFRVRGRNEQSTITDEYRERGSDHYDIAFDTYAIDWGDVDSTYLESIFRIGFDEYPGITQSAETKYSTNLGEYSFFFGTEFKKDLFLGVSAALTSGNYTYRRDFLEIDDQNNYNYNFIPSDVNEEGTDIDRILTHDEIDADIVAFTLRTGIIYKVSPKINLGLSYLIPSTLVVTENYYSSIRTELDDGSTPFESDIASDYEYEYRVKKPGQLNIGMALNDFSNFNFSVSGELINYSNLRLDLITGNSLGYDDEEGLRVQQDELAEFMQENYNRVINIKSSVGYQLKDGSEVKLGYAFLPGKSEVYKSDRNVISAGFSAYITESIVFDVNGQYSFWNDRSELYNYYDYSDNVARSEVVDHQVSTVKVLAGVKFLF